MAFFFTCGTHTFSSILQGYENITVQCQNCGNFSAKVKKRWEWFTLCFVPLIPFSLKPWHEVSCHICRFHQDIKFRPEVQQMMENGGGGNIPLQGPPQHPQGPGQNQGWNGGGGQGQQQQAGYGHPAYK